MNVKTIRAEQTEADMKCIDRVLDNEFYSFKQEGYNIHDIRAAAGRDADATSCLKKCFSLTLVILYS